MKLKAKNIIAHTNKHDVLIGLIITVAVIFVVSVWIWYGHKSEQLEKEIYLLK